MSEQQRKDIRTIAKTNEIIEKVNRAITNTPPIRKEPIPTKRVITTQLGNGTRSATNGYNGGGNSTGGATGADGLPVIAPLAPPPIAPLGSNNVVTGAGSGFNDYISRGGINYKGSIEQGTSNPNGGGSRSDAVNRADPANATGQVGDDLTNLRNSTAYQNATAEERRRMELALLNQETPDPGTYEVGQTYEGEDGPKYEPGTWTTIDGIPVLMGTAIEQLNALVGVDPDDPSTTVIIVVGGKTIVPSAVEAAGAGQNEWTSPDLPPIKKTFIQGMFWTVTGGYIGTTITGQTFDEVIAARQAKDSSTAYALDNSNIVLAGTPSPGSAQVGFSISAQTVGMAFSGGTIYVVGSFVGNSIEQVDCSSNGNPAVCLLSPPRETAWPIVGAYAVKYANGVFSKYQYDSEASLKYATPVSAIAIRSAVTNENYLFESGIAGGHILSNTTAPDYFLFYGADRTLRTPPLPISYIKFFKPR